MPLTWTRATIGWMAPGHCLYVSHNLQERALWLLLGSVRAWLDEQESLMPVSVSGEPMVIDSRSGTTFGTLTLSSETLLNFDAATLRDELNRLTVEAERVAAEQVALEDQLAAEFLEVLREQI